MHWLGRIPISLWCSGHSFHGAGKSLNRKDDCAEDWRETWTGNRTL